MQGTLHAPWRMMGPGIHVGEDKLFESVQRAREDFVPLGVREDHETLHGANHDAVCVACRYRGQRNVRAEIQVKVGV